MTGNIYPFKLDGVILAKVHLERPPQPPEHYETSVELHVKIVQDRMPDILQVDLRAITPEEQVVKIDMIVIGLFRHLDGEPVPDEDQILTFVTERALYILWAYIDQVIVTTTAQMGITPIRLITPSEFNMNLPSSQQETQE